MLHACFLSNAYMFPSYFHTFTFVFRMFSHTNILTRCPRPVAVFCMFFVSEILLRKYSQNRLKIHGSQFLLERRQGPKETQRGARGPPEDPQARVHPRPRLVGPWAPWPPHPVASLPIRCLNPKKFGDGVIFHENHR